jgi:hypothetical protein
MCEETKAVLQRMQNSKIDFKVSRLFPPMYEERKHWCKENAVTSKEITLKICKETKAACCFTQHVNSKHGFNSKYAD